MGNCLDPAGIRLLPQSTLKFLLTRREETAYRYHPSACLIDHTLNFRQMLLDGHLAR